MSEITRLLYKENVSTDTLLSITSLIHTYCQLNADCTGNAKLIRDVSYIEQKIKENISIKENRDEVMKIKHLSKTSRDNFVFFIFSAQALLWLKSLGNAGLTTPTVLHTLHSIIMNIDVTVDIRVSAVQAYRWVKM